jgi:hypothetical protein
MLWCKQAPDTGELRALHVATVINPLRGIFPPRRVRAGALCAAVCRQCGYTEPHTEDPQSIHVDGDYVREIVGPAP